MRIQRGALKARDGSVHNDMGNKGVFGVRQKLSTRLLFLLQFTQRTRAANASFNPKP